MEENIKSLTHIQNPCGLGEIKIKGIRGAGATAAFLQTTYLSNLFACSRPLQVDYALIASQAGATLNNLLSRAQELVSKLRSLQLDQREFVCLKFLVLFSLGE